MPAIPTLFNEVKPSVIGHTVIRHERQVSVCHDARDATERS